MTHHAFDDLKACCPALAAALAALPKDKLERFLTARRLHVDHPLKWLLEARGQPDSLPYQVLINTELAVRAIADQRCFESWLQRRIREAATLPTGNSFEQQYSGSEPYKALSEIRAVGYLLSFFSQVVPHSAAGPDLTLRWHSEECAVEISAVRMDHAEARALTEFHNRRASRCDELVVHPAGCPKPGEFTVDNVAHKFVNKAQEKNDQLPQCRPAVLWLDLQFEDLWSLDCNEAWPLYVLRSGRFRTGGVWLSFYANKDTPLMDSESIEEGSPPDVRGICHTSMRYPGYFASGGARASAVVISWPDCTVLFENPWAASPLPRAIVEGLLHLRWFDWPRSWVRPFWKETAAAQADLQGRVRVALDDIAAVARIARRDW